MSEQAQAQTTPEQRAELARLADGAQQGDWVAEECSLFASDIVRWGNKPGDGNKTDGYFGGVSAKTSDRDSAVICGCWDDKDRDFIAAANPVAVKALIADLASAEKRAAVAEAQLAEERALWVTMDAALEQKEICGAMYRERNADGGVYGVDSPMWMGPLARSGACGSARELAMELYTGEPDWVRRQRAALGLAAPAEQ